MFDVLMRWFRIWCNFVTDWFVFVFQTKVVEKHFSGHQLTPDNVKLVHQSLQHRMQYLRVSNTGCNISG